MAFNRVLKEANGNANQFADRDINTTNNHHYHHSQPQLRDSAIAKILTELYDVTEQQRLAFTPPDTRVYSVRDKIRHNRLSEYSRFYDNFASYLPFVQYTINNTSDSDPSFRVRVIRYIQGKYRAAIMAIQPNENVAIDNPDTVIFHICESVKKDLENCSTPIEVEGLDDVAYIVFYVFAECEIFDKPPSE